MLYVENEIFLLDGIIHFKKFYGVGFLDSKANVYTNHFAEDELMIAHVCEKNLDTLFFRLSILSSILLIYSIGEPQLGPREPMSTKLILDQAGALCTCLNF